MKSEKILVIGGTGYIGSRVVMTLLGKGYVVRVSYRDYNKIEDRMWNSHPKLETVYVDVYNQDSVIDAFEEISVVYYLIHSMNPAHKDFAKWDRIAARNMVIAANKYSIRNIIYLGGLGSQSESISKHLYSRSQVGKILQASKIPTTIFQAAMIIGSGSTSFEMLRYLVDRLPFMITPKWISTPNQPISIRNVVDYLVLCLENEVTVGKTFDIGGPEILSYKDLIEIYAEEASLRKRIIVSLPFNDPLASTAHIISRLIPLHSSVIQPLIESLRNEVVCQNDDIQNYITLDLLSARESIRRTIAETKQALLHNMMQEIGWIPPVDWSMRGDPDYAGGSVYYDRRVVLLEGDPNNLWSTIAGIGGENGWYHANYLWKIRGYIDELMGGPGMRRGRAHPRKLKQGDILDCWRVRKVDIGSELLLSAEMILPGHGTLQFKIIPRKNGRFILDQIACFVPRGLGGLIYWEFMAPFHSSVFNGLIKGIIKKSACNLIYGPKFIQKNDKKLHP